MNVDVPQVVVLIFGILIGLLSAWGMYAPERLVGFVKGVMIQQSGIYAAVIARVLLGVALILAAAGSRYPVVFQVLGWITLLAAVGLVFLGRERLRIIISWFDQFSPVFIRLWLLLGIAFGGFLVYGVS